MKKNLQILREIYPPYFLILALFPLVLGSFIDVDLVESRDFVIQYIWISFFSIGHLLLKNRWIYRTTVLLYFFVGCLEIIHWVMLKGPITLTSLLVLSNTNWQEAQEFFTLKASLGLFLLLPYILLLRLAWKTQFEYENSKLKNAWLAVLSILVLVFISENALHGRLIRKGIPAFAKVGCSFYTQLNLFQEAAKSNFPKRVDAHTGFTEAQQTFVLILGESCNRNHMSLYSASRQTNPKLKARNDLAVFINVVAPFSNTLSSVLSILSNSNLEHPIPFGDAVDVLDVFHSAGFKTYWISNQSPIGVWDNLVTVLANKADEKYFVNTSSNSSFEAIQTTSYDSKLFQPFATALKAPVNKKFIVLHLMGSHATYAKRYPPNFSNFTGFSDKEIMKAAYDNSILYNDYIVDSLMSSLVAFASKSNQVAAAIYLADHGENVFDEGENVGHDYTKILPKANVEIPYLVWLSPNYKKVHPAKVVSLNSNLNKAFVSDDLFHSLLDLAGIESKFWEESRSNLNSNFNASRKRILEDGWDYDVERVK